jgi:hypothetical protein
MKIFSFIEEPDIIRKILRHCNLWKDPPMRAPPSKPPPLLPQMEEPVLDYGFFANNCV